MPYFARQKYFCLDKSCFCQQKYGCYKRLPIDEYPCVRVSAIFQVFLLHFVLVKLVTSNIRVKGHPVFCFICGVLNLHGTCFLPPPVCLIIQHYHCSAIDLKALNDGLLQIHGKDDTEEELTRGMSSLGFGHSFGHSTVSLLIKYLSQLGQGL